jgi:hypothetical protein
LSPEGKKLALEKASEYGLVFEPVMKDSEILSNGIKNAPCSYSPISLFTAGKQAWWRREVPRAGDKAPDPLHRTVLCCYGR